MKNLILILTIVACFSSSAQILNKVGVWADLGAGRGLPTNAHITSGLGISYSGVVFNMLATATSDLERDVSYITIEGGKIWTKGDFYMTAQAGFARAEATETKMEWSSISSFPILEQRSWQVKRWGISARLKGGIMLSDYHGVWLMVSSIAVNEYNQMNLSVGLSVDLLRRKT